MRFRSVPYRILNISFLKILHENCFYLLLSVVFTKIFVQFNSILYSSQFYKYENNMLEEDNADSIIAGTNAP